MKLRACGIIVETEIEMSSRIKRNACEVVNYSSTLLMLG